MATRQDSLNLQADTVLETAIASLLAFETAPGDGAPGKVMTRKEALRYLTRRLLRQDVTSYHRQRAANTPGVAVMRIIRGI